MVRKTQSHDHAANRVAAEGAFRNITASAIEWIGHRDRSRTLLTPQFDVPFSLPLQDLVAYGEYYLLTRAPPACRHILEQTRPRLLAHLASQLAPLLCRILLVDFTTYRARHLTDLDVKLMQQSSKKRADLQIAFTEYLATGGWKQIFKSYAAVPLLLGTRLSNWCSSSIEFATRFVRDLAEISSVFSCCATLQDVVFGASDLHNQGRGVNILIMRDGTKIVYKHGDLAVYARLGELSHHMHVATGLEPFRCPKTLTRENYGWQQFVEHFPTEDRNSIAGFYTRCGATLALMHCFNAEDLHHENIISNNGMPYLVDCECFMAPALRNREGERDVFLAFRTSVLRTGMLPRWNSLFGGHFDVSALGARRDVENNEMRPHWIDGNYDSVGVINKISLAVQVATHLPSTRNGSPHSFLERLLVGFKCAYDFLWRGRKRTVRLARSLAVGRARGVFRTTREYMLVLRACTDPATMNSEEDFKSTLWSILNVRGESLHPSIIESEFQQLARLDIPHFLIHRDGTQRYPGCVPGIEIAEANIDQLSREHFRTQYRIIEGALSASSIPRKIEIPSSPMGQRDLSVNLSEEIASIKKLILENALGSRDDVSWLTLDYDEGMLRYQLDVMKNTLYSGRLGVSIFLMSSAGEASVERNTMKLAHSILRPITANVQKGEICGPLLPKEMGAFFGKSSVAYCLLIAFDFSQCELYLSCSLKILRYIANEISLIDGPDFLHGAAGVLRVYLAAYDRTGEKWLLDTASKIGEKLLPVDEFCSNWKSRLSDKCLVGFAHGAAGIAYCMATLAARTADDRHTRAAKIGFSYCKRKVDENHGVVPDDRDFVDRERSSGFQFSWCTGMSGYRLAVGAAKKELPLESFFYANEAQSWSSKKIQLDHYCCGQAGLLEVLLSEGGMEARKMAADVALRMANRARAGGFHFYGDLNPGIPNVSFMRGLSGVGYAFSRLAHPALPSILLLQ